jgi:hypothetical protein
MNMRRIIVAVDPNSITSPKDILDRWKEVFRDLQYTIWNDTDYMPKLFVKGNYTGVPDYSSKQVKIVKDQIVHTPWHGNVVSNKNNLTQEQIKSDLLSINNHRFRQRTFVAEC